MFLGNVIQRKGLHTLLEAAGRLQSPIRLDVVGSLDSEPDYAREIQKRAKLSNLQSRVFFHGSLDNEELVAKFKSSHALVVPSSYEGFGIVYLEGMGFGLPAIGTTAGGATEIISDGETGYLIPPDDAELLAKRLSQLVRDRNLLTRMSLNALKRYREQPTWEETARKMREFLLSMIENQRPLE